MTLPAKMLALTLRHDGFSDTPSALDLEDLGEWVALEEIAVPEPGPGQALVRIARAAVNPSDVIYMKGHYGQSRRKGVPVGFEGTGTVVAGDTPLVGQRVSFAATASGTWAEYALTDAQMLVPLHPAVSDENAASLIVNPVSAMAMFDLVRQSGAESFVVTAAGSQLGKFLIGLARERGLSCIATVRRPELVRPLTDLGAAAVLVETDPGFADACRDAMATSKPTVLLDAVGGPLSAQLFFAMPAGARWVNYGRLSAEPPQLDQIQQLVFQGKSIEGFWLPLWLGATPPENTARIFADVQEHFADGRWHTEVTATVRLADALSALPAAYAAKDGKVQITP